MTIFFHQQPLQWYVDQLVNQQPFTSLLYGDGEFYVLSRTRTNQRLGHGEIVTKQLEQEMRDSLLINVPNIYRASDRNLIEPWMYGGRDIAQMWEVHNLWDRVLKELDNPITDIYDGAVWEVSVREGLLNPFLVALQNLNVIVIGNYLLKKCTFLNYKHFIQIPLQNAYGSIDDIHNRCPCDTIEPCVWLVCAGLTTIPLIARLRAKRPQDTYLDLGSTFDVFVKLPSRGWRIELYQDPERYNEVLRKNLQGITDQLDFS